MTPDKKMRTTMKSMSRHLISCSLVMAVLCLCGISSSVHALSFSATSGLIRVPSARVESAVGYQVYGEEQWLTFARKYLGGRFEVGGRRHASTGQTTAGYKLSMLQPGSLMPGLAFGAYDFGAPDREISYFAVSTLSLPSTGTTIHAGLISEGPWKDMASLSQSLDLRQAVDAMSRTRSWFVGVEQNILPMTGIMAETIDEVINAGIRFRPMYQITLDIVYFDIAGIRALPETRAFNLNISFTY